MTDFRTRLKSAHAFAVDLDSHELTEVYHDEELPDVIDEIERADCPANGTGHVFLTQCGKCGCVYCGVMVP